MVVYGVSFGELVSAKRLQMFFSNGRRNFWNENYENTYYNSLVLLLGWFLTRSRGK